MTLFLPTSILITGASSGIGEALALTYANKGITLALTGRNKDRLEAIARACRDKGALVTIHLIDVADKCAMRRLIEDCDKTEPLDLVIANAGISGGSGGTGETEEQTRDIFAINLAGVINTVFPAIDIMTNRGDKNPKGQIAIVSSLAGFRGMPSAPAYAASKAAVLSWGDGLRLSLRPKKILVSVICPGFVRSRITDRNSFPMPFFMEADKAAQIIQKRLIKGKGRICFPAPMHFIMWLLGALPTSLTDLLFARLPAKD